jgi:hypothetical protein
MATRPKITTLHPLVLPYTSQFSIILKVQYRETHMIHVAVRGCKRIFLEAAHAVCNLNPIYKQQCKYLLMLIPSTTNLTPFHVFRFIKQHLESIRDR